jgi:hypothetical protein
MNELIAFGALIGLAFVCYRAGYVRGHMAGYYEGWGQALTDKHATGRREQG